MMQTASDSDAGPASGEPGLGVAAAIEEGQRTLTPRSGPDARREAVLLLAGTMGLTPGELLLLNGPVVEAQAVVEYRLRLARRARGEPLQYIEERAAFRDLSLHVGPSVLIPRPETEQLVQAVLDWCRGREPLRGLDLGTGSGAIAISLAREGPFRQVVAVDISAPALKVARQNAADAGVEARVEFRRGSLFGVLQPDERYDVIVSNPPYIANGEAADLPEEVRAWEPAEALFAGPTGMEVIARIVAGAARHLAEPGLLALEIAPALAEPTLEALEAQEVYAEPRVIRDLAGRRRIITAERLSSSGYEPPERRLLP